MDTKTLFIKRQNDGIKTLSQSHTHTYTMRENARKIYGETDTDKTVSGGFGGGGVVCVRERESEEYVNFTSHKRE